MRWWDTQATWLAKILSRNNFRCIHAKYITLYMCVCTIKRMGCPECVFRFYFFLESSSSSTAFQITVQNSTLLCTCYSYNQPNWFDWFVNGLIDPNEFIDRQWFAFDLMKIANFLCRWIELIRMIELYCVPHTLSMRFRWPYFFVCTRHTYAHKHTLIHMRRKRVYTGRRCITSGRIHRHTTDIRMDDCLIRRIGVTLAAHHNNSWTTFNSPLSIFLVWIRIEWGFFYI